MKRENKALTLVELLIVLAIMALLVGILIPALSVVKKAAREVKQKAQFATIEMALQAFRNDYGDYPPSKGFNYPADPGGDGYLNYCGAQKLAEALVGWDLLGFHPKSDWLSTGRNLAEIDIYDANDPLLLDQRKGPYLELATASVFRLGNISPQYPGLFRDTDPLNPDTFVLCDAFGAKTVMMPNGKVVKAGAPVLYYRANQSAKTITQIYDPRDNDMIVMIKQTDDAKDHPLGYTAGGYQNFYDYIRDPKITAMPQPYRPKSYILISAGSDGLYGTSDDIKNFGD